jgi:hypothetical protein
MNRAESSKPILVYCRRYDRLGARLKNLLAAMCFAEALGGNLRVIWPLRARITGQYSTEYDAGGHLFFELFDKDVLAASLPWLEIINRKLTEDDLADYQQSHKVSTLGSRSLASVLNDNFHSLDFNITTPYNFTDLPKSEHLLADTFARLPLHPVVASVLEEATETTGIKDGISLHIRRGDIMHITHLPAETNHQADEGHQTKQISNYVARYAPDKTYMAAISSSPYKKRRVAVFSDDASTKERFRLALRDRYIDYDGILDKSSLSSYQRDFVELLLISKSRVSIGARSHFVEIAALLAKKQHQRITNYISAEAITESLDEQLAGTGADETRLKTIILNEYLQLFNKSGAIEEAMKLRSSLNAVYP